jgi:hypothetical protein
MTTQAGTYEPVVTRVSWLTHRVAEPASRAWTPKPRVSPSIPSTKIRAGRAEESDQSLSPTGHLNDRRRHATTHW